MITLYDKNETDFTGNGLLVLDKYVTSAVVHEELNGEYSLDLEFASEDNVYTNQIEVESIISVPAPVREAPELDNMTTHKLYKTSRKTQLLAGASNYAKQLRTLKNNTSLIWLKTSNNGVMYKVSTTDGAQGWVRVAHVSYVGEQAATAPGYQVLPAQSVNQFFRVFNVQHTLEGVVVKCKHLFYDLADNYVKTISAKNMVGATAFNRLLTECIYEHEFEGVSDVAATLTAELGRTNPVDSMLSDDGLLLAGGQILRDNYNVYYLSRVGKNRGASIAYRKNMTGMTIEVDTSEVVTRIVPVGYSSSGSPIYLDEQYIDSPRLADYGNPKVAELDCRDIKRGKDYTSNTAVKNALRARVAEEFANGCDMPKIIGDIEFVDLDVANLGALKSIYLGDEVTIKHEDYGFDLTAQVVAYDWDCLTQEYKNIQLGEIGATLANLRINRNMIPKNTIAARSIIPGSAGSIVISPDAADTILPSSEPEDPWVGMTWADPASGTVKQWDGETWILLSITKQQSIEAVRAHIKELIAGGVTTDELYAALATIAVAQITTANIDNAAIDWAEIGNLSTELASIAQAQITTANINQANIDWATIANLNAQVATIAQAQITTAVIDNAAIDWASITTLSAAVANIAAAQLTTANINSANIDWASIINLNAQMATVAAAKIGSANIQHAQIHYTDTDELIFREGLGGELFIDRLAVVQAQVVDAVIGSLTLVDDDGSLYKVGIGENGELTATPTGETSADMAGGGLPEGWRAVAESVTAGTVNSGRIVSQKGTFIDLIASSVTASVLTASEAFITKLNAVDISSNESLSIYVKGDELSDKVSNITLSKDTIKSWVGGLYVPDDENYQKDKTQLGTVANQTKEALEWQANIIKDDLVTLQKWMKFTTAGLMIGQTGSPFSVLYGSERIAFRINGQEVAYLSNNKLYITQAEILNRMQIGKVAFEPQTNGNMSLVYTG